MGVHFQTGVSYVAGFDKPAILSLSTIRRAVEGQGFAVLGVYECSSMPGLPFAVPGVCGDEWDYVALVKRTGAPKYIDVPDRVAWLVAIPPPGQPPPALARPGELPPPPGVTQPTLVTQRTGGLDKRKALHIGAELAGLFVAAPIMWWAGGKLPKGSKGRTAIRVAAVGTALVDAALLASYAVD